MYKRYKMAKKTLSKVFNPLSRAHQRYRQTDDRHTTDGFAIAKTRT